MRLVSHSAGIIPGMTHFQPQRDASQREDEGERARKPKRGSAARVAANFALRAIGRNSAPQDAGRGRMCSAGLRALWGTTEHEIWRDCDRTTKFRGNTQGSFNSASSAG